MISRIRLALIVSAAFAGTLSAQEAKPTPASALAEDAAGEAIKRIRRRRPVANATA